MQQSQGMSILQRQTKASISFFVIFQIRNPGLLPVGLGHQLNLYFSIVIISPRLSQASTQIISLLSLFTTGGSFFVFPFYRGSLLPQNYVTIKKGMDLLIYHFVMFIIFIESFIVAVIVFPCDVICPCKLRLIKLSRSVLTFIKPFVLVDIFVLFLCEIYI